MKKYDNYKDSGIEWLGEIPEHWEVKSFRFCIDVLTDYTANGSFASLAENVTYYDAGYSRLVRLTDLRVNLINEGLYVNENAHNFLKKSELFGGEILIANVGAYAGLVMQMPKIEGKYTLGPNMFLLKVNQNANFFINQLNAQFCSEQLKLMAISSAQPKLNKENIRQLKVVTPSSEEQTAIANYLDHKTTQIDTLIAKKEQFISLLQEERTAVINQAVTKGLDPKVKMKDSGIEWLGEIPEHWTSYRIDWVTDIVRGNTGFKKDELLKNGEYVALQYGKTYKVDIVDDNFNFFVNSEFFKESQVVSKGDTILISTSETVEDLGHTCFYNNENIGLLGGEQILLKPNRKVLHEKYLYQYARQFRLELKKYAKGLKVFRFNTTDLKQVFIAIPSIEEQIQIADFLDLEAIRINSLISKSKQEIELLKEYKTALISEVVTGKVDVRERILN